MAEVPPQAAQHSAPAVLYRDERWLPLFSVHQFGDEQPCVRQLVERRAPGLVVAAARGQACPVAIVEMLHQLGDDFLFARRIDRQLGEDLANVFAPVRHVRPP